MTNKLVNTLVKFGKGTLLPEVLGDIIKSEELNNINILDFANNIPNTSNSFNFTIFYTSTTTTGTPTKRSWSYATGIMVRRQQLTYILMINHQGYMASNAFSSGAWTGWKIHEGIVD